MSLPLLKWRITDDKPGGCSKALKAINPPGGHDGYAVVSEGRVVAVCKFYGRALDLAGKIGGYVSSRSACLKLGYIKAGGPAPTKTK